MFFPVLDLLAEAVHSMTVSAGNPFCTHKTNNSVEGTCGSIVILRVLIRLNMNNNLKYNAIAKPYKLCHLLMMELLKEHPLTLTTTTPSILEERDRTVI